MKASTVILLAIIGFLISVIIINNDASAFIEQVHKREKQEIRDSLSKCNGIVKENNFKSLCDTSNSKNHD